MSTVVRVGLEPLPLVVTLTTGADFEDELTYKVDGVPTSWPGGTSLDYVFSDSAGTVFEGDISGAVASFVVDKAVCDPIPQGTKVRLRYVNGSTDRILWVGTVSRRG